MLLGTWKRSPSPAFFSTYIFPNLTILAKPLSREISSAASRRTHNQQSLPSIVSNAHCPPTLPPHWPQNQLVNSVEVRWVTAWDSSLRPGQHLQSGQGNKECKNMKALGLHDFPVCPICHSASRGFSTITHDPNVVWETLRVPSRIAARSECISHIAVETSIPRAKKTPVSQKLPLQTLEYRWARSNHALHLGPVDLQHTCIGGKSIGAS